LLLYRALSAIPWSGAGAEGKNLGTDHVTADILSINAPIVLCVSRQIHGQGKTGAHDPLPIEYYVAKTGIARDLQFISFHIRDRGPGESWALRDVLGIIRGCQQLRTAGDGSEDGQLNLSSVDQVA